MTSTACSGQSSADDCLLQSHHPVPWRLTMAKTIKASFANGVFTPLEPLLDIEEGSVFVLNIETALFESEQEESELQAVPVDDDPKRLKSILDEMDVEDYLRNRNS